MSMVGLYITSLFTCPHTVTHPSSNYLLATYLIARKLLLIYRPAEDRRLNY